MPGPVLTHLFPSSAYILPRRLLLLTNEENHSLGRLSDLCNDTRAQTSYFGAKIQNVSTLPEGTEGLEEGG